MMLIIQQLETILYDVVLAVTKTWSRNCGNNSITCANVGFRFTNREKVMNLISTQNPFRYFSFPVHATEVHTDWHGLLENTFAEYIYIIEIGSSDDSEVNLLKIELVGGDAR